MIKLKRLSVLLLIPLILNINGCFSPKENSEATVETTSISNSENYEFDKLAIDKNTFSDDDVLKFARNYTSAEIDGISYEFANAGKTKKDDILFCIYPYTQGFSDNNAAFYNTTAINGINSITITYSCNSPFDILYGNNMYDLEYRQTLPVHKMPEQMEIVFADKASYFRIETNDDNILVYDMVINYDNDSQDEANSLNYQGYRYVPKTNYNPREGDMLSAPICELDNAGNVTVKEWRDYTYHTFDYCKNKIKKGDMPEKYALTEAEDVANYFMLFKKFPPNYGSVQVVNGELYTDMKIQTVEPATLVKDVFGDKLTRTVSEYYRNKSGYTEDLPLKLNKNKKLLYYELDIALDDTYSIKSRGTGRIVAFADGFSCYDDKLPVMLLTRNHYFSFAEYSNAGFFNKEFNAMSEGYCHYNYNECEEIIIK